MDPIVVLVIAPVVAVVLIVNTLKVVPQGYSYTVERFGKYTKTLAPGMSWVFPFFDRIGRKMNMMETVLDWL